MLWFICLKVFAQESFNIEVLNNVRDKTSGYRSQLLSTHHLKIPESAYIQASQGKIATGLQSVAGHKAKIGWGVGVFHVSIDRFWASINNGDRHAGKTPISFAKIVDGKACKDKRKMFMILPLPIVSDRWWVVETSMNPNLEKSSRGTVREMSWKNVKDPKSYVAEEYRSQLHDMVNISFTQGAWVLTDIGNGYTLGEYHTWADSGGSVPADLTAHFVEGNIIKTMLAMEDYSRGTELPCLNP